MATPTARTDLPVRAHTGRAAVAFALHTVRAWHSHVSRENLVLCLEELTGAALAHTEAEHSLVLEFTAPDPDTLSVCLADAPVSRRADRRRRGDRHRRGSRR